MTILNILFSFHLAWFIVAYSGCLLSLSSYQLDQIVVCIPSYKNILFVVVPSLLITTKIHGSEEISTNSYGKLLLTVQVRMCGLFK